jgi:hypothetical protein
LIGGTINILSTDSSHGRRTDAAIAFHYGAQAKLEFDLSGAVLRFGYEYRRMSPTDYDLGFDLHLGRRDAHTMMFTLTVTH